MWGIKIGIFEAAESIPMLGFTPKCKRLDLIILLLVGIVKMGTKISIFKSAESFHGLSFIPLCKVID